MFDGKNYAHEDLNKYNSKQRVWLDSCWRSECLKKEMADPQQNDES
jgi:hypothetical protein